MRVRLLRIEGVDLNVFEFDYDLTWTAFFMNASGKMYGRYGGRDAKGPDTRNSLAGLSYAMKAALATHRKDPKVQPENRGDTPVYVEKIPAAKSYRGCIHCHQVKEIMRQDQLNTGTWVRESIYTYPLPENIGITLDVDRGNAVRLVKPDSAAAKIGVKPGDSISAINGIAVNSFADAQYALHKAPLTGKTPIGWQRDGERMTGALTLEVGWRRTNVTWRPSLLDLLPSLTVYGDDLSAAQKKALGFDEKRLAFRQDAQVHSAAKAMGVQAGDIILGIDNKKLEMSMDQFLGHVRQNYLIGESATLNLLRNGKRLDLKITLK
ncbi:MAG: PDZ domain-containing protein [Planctomycetes bacterium]|nr:PDZ domain-containing protein [Planctomycetota bacterium]